MADEAHSQFSIGKSYGLSNNPKAIPDYQQKFEEIRQELKKIVEVEEKDTKLLMEALTSELNKKVFSAQQQIVENLEKIFEKINKHSNESFPKDPKYKGMSDEVLKLAVESFKKNIAVLIIDEQELTGKLKDFSNNLKLSLERVEKKRNEFIAALEKEKLDISEFEKGYIHGDALRIALGGNNEQNQQ